MDILILLLIFTSSILILIISVSAFASFLLNRKKDMPKIYTVIPVDTATNNAEYLLRSVLWDLKWKNSNSNRIIILTFNKADEDVQKVCEKLRSEYGDMLICAGDELVTYLKTLPVDK